MYVCVYVCMYVFKYRYTTKEYVQCFFLFCFVLVSKWASTNDRKNPGVGIRFFFKFRAVDGGVCSPQLTLDHHRKPFSRLLFLSLFVNIQKCLAPLRTVP
jgi:hypothetical protein